MTRRRAAHALLVLVATWPLVTLWLQARWGVDPWKLMSFGMYAAPGRRLDDVRLTVSVQRGGAWEPLGPGVAAEAVERYRRARRTLGRLAPAPPLLEALGAATGGQAVQVEVVEVRLDPDTARVVHRRELLER